MSSSLSTHSVVRLTLPNRLDTSSLSSSPTSSPAKTPLAPSPSSAGVFGMTLTTLGLAGLDHPRSVSMAIPAAMEMNSGALPSASFAHAAPSS